MNAHEHRLVHVALFIALEIILSRFCSIQTPIAKIGFAFVPVALCGMLYGPVWAGILGGISDMLGAILFPFGGNYFPGFTISAILAGATYGVFLHKKEQSIYNLCIALFINRFMISLGLSTFWLTIITRVPYRLLLIARITQNILLFCVELAILRTIQIKWTSIQQILKN